MTDAATGNRLHRNSIADTPDQLLFFGFFVVGGASIVLTKTLGLPQAIVTSIPIFLIFLYAFVVLKTKRYRMREDRIGENSYYLGFLYTLVSLAYALYLYDPSGGGASDIMSNFGVALGTTIVGLALRVVFNQMREDPVEYEREARQSLAEASMALRTQLSDIAMEMSGFKRKVMQIIEEGVTDVSKSAQASMTENVERFAGVATEVNEKIRSAFETFSAHSSRLSEVASHNVEALQALFERIERIEASPDLLAAKLDPIIEKFNEVASESLKRNRAQTSDLKRMREAIDVAISASETLRASIAGSDKILFDRVGGVASGLDAIVGDAAKVTEALTRSGGELTRQVEAIARATGEVNQSLGAQQSAAAELRSGIEADLQAIRRHRDAMTAMAAESREAVSAVQTSLVSLTRTMVEQLGDR